MAEKSDDIKKLFLNLGLNPSDYHEIRTAPTANATVSEAPRRWSLLQAAASTKPSTAPARPITFAAPVSAVAAAPLLAPTPTPAPVAPAPQDVGFSVSMLPAALLAAAQDIARAESTAAPALVVPAPEPIIAESVPVIGTPLPSAIADAFVQAMPNDGLQSLFQSVKEPQTVASAAFSGDASRPTERRTDQLFGRTPAVPSMAERAAAMPELRSPPLLPTLPPLVDSIDEPETRYAPPPSRLGPLPAPFTPPSVSMSFAPPNVPTPAPVPVMAQPLPSAPLASPQPSPPVSEGRLRFTVPPVESAKGHGESLQDVFRRLSRDNRG